MPKDRVKKAVLAYSGGLDTSIIVTWLKETYGCEVVCFTADIGQGVGETASLAKRARESGATRLITEDLREEFARDYIFPLIRSGAVYEGKYLLGTSIARPLIAKHQVMAAEQVGADAVAHGCTGKGNDQVRFELTYTAVNPRLKVIAPWREWNIRSREDAVAYAKAHHITLPDTTGKSLYSRDRNLWHLSHEGGPLENLANAPEEDLFQLTVSPGKAPDRPETVEIGFERGNPVSLNGKKLAGAKLIEALNDIGGRNAIGRVDLVENRLVGMKSRGVYETPGGTILVAAHRELESITLDRETQHYKERVAQRYAELVYFGQWFTPLREDLQAYIDKTQEHVTGSITLDLYKGNVIVQKRSSPFSLYREDFATFGHSLVYDHSDAAGFIHLFGLPLKVRALLEEGGKGIPPVPPEEVDRD
ncbi:MAG: argininosuccinate synthase [Anaerolineales bacterium]|nr:argininosuccinate synthase [Anaerolineales bacterium]